MHEHWEHKKRRSAGMSNPQIDEWYDLGLQQRRARRQTGRRRRRRLPDVLRGRSQRLRHAMTTAGLEEVRFRFDFEGTKVLFA